MRERVATKAKPLPFPFEATLCKTLRVLWGLFISVYTWYAIGFCRQHNLNFVWIAAIFRSLAVLKRWGDFIWVGNRVEVVP
jgi:hypothetical protein